MLITPTSKQKAALEIKRVSKKVPVREVRTKEDLERSFNEK